MAVVETRDLVKHFGKVGAVNGVNLEVREAEFLVILGPSGCGKTTLMRMIAGLEKPTSGRIFIGGQEVTRLPPRDRKIAMVFQSYALYPHMTVFENISFPLRARREPQAEIHNKVESAATLLGIERLLERHPRQLSGGERQRVALCRALVKEPQVMLLDEPLSNLDAKLRATARDELLRFQRRTGITTIFVTHDQIEAMGMGDRIVVMNAGKVRQIGTPHEIYHDSQDIFVSTFLGSPGMNLIDLNDFQVGFRPEQFVPKQVADRRNEVREFSFHVNRIEYLGADRLLYGQVEEFGEDSLVIARLPEAMDVPITAEQTYEFGVSRKDLRFFNRETGKRIEPQDF
jgi:multiple sugar transport system ATP-binding protein